MCNDLCVPVLVKPTNDVTLFYAMPLSKSRYIQICHDEAKKLCPLRCLLML